MDDFFPFFKKIGFLGILDPPYCGISATIRIGREMLSLPYAVFFLNMCYNAVQCSAEEEEARLCLDPSLEAWHYTPPLHSYQPSEKKDSRFIFPLTNYMACICLNRVFPVSKVEREKKLVKNCLSIKLLKEISDFFIYIFLDLF